MERKIIQIAVAVATADERNTEYVYALASDGTLWSGDPGTDNPRWRRVKGIPAEPPTEVTP